MALGISDSDLAGWRHHPVSKVFFRYLSDKRAYHERAALDEWLGGKLSLQAEQTIRGQIIELFEIENISWDEIESFYQEKEINEA